MHQPPERDALLTEFNRERSIRRTVKVLETKRKRIRDELEQLVSHLSLLVPLAGSPQKVVESQSELLQEALQRMNDDAFAQLLLQIIQKSSEF